MTTTPLQQPSSYVIRHKVNTPAWAAAQVYRTQPCTRTFQEDLELHLLFGYVFSTSSYFIMGRPVCSGAPDREICDPLISFDPQYCDMWHIHCMAGDKSKVFEIMPHMLPLISFQGKNNKLRKYSFEYLKQKLIAHTNHG